MGTKTLLIVDDSRVSRMILLNLLGTLSQELQLHQAGNGDEAIALAREHRFDAISMDLNMPGIDGIDTAARIREIQPGVPIMLLTANVQSAIQERSSLSGLRFMSKPVNAEAASTLLALAGERDAV